MSERVTRLAVVAALAMAAFAPAAAQDRAELTRRIRVGMAMADSNARAGRQLAVDAVVRHAYTDTVTMMGGAVSLLTTRELLPLAQRAAARADSALMARLAPAMDLLRGQRFTVREDTAWRRIDGSRNVLISEFTPENSEVYGGGYVRPDTMDLSARLEERIQQVMIVKATNAVSRWLPGPFPMTKTEADAWARARLDLVSSPTLAGRKCYSGDHTACMYMLGFALPADPASALYDSVGRRALVNDHLWRARGMNALGTDRCLKHSDSDCILVVRALLTQSSPSASKRLRETLAHEILDLGGPGAVARLATSKDSIGPTLAAAAGVPIDSVIALWLDELHTQGVGSDDFTPGIAALSIGWVLVLGGLAMRSGRWR